MDDVGRISIFLIFLIFSFIFSAMLVCFRNINISKLQNDLMENEGEYPSSLKKVLEVNLEKQISNFYLSFMLTEIFTVLSLNHIVKYYFIDKLNSWDFFVTSYGYVIVNIIVFIIIASFVLVISFALPQKIFCHNSEKILIKIYPLAFVINFLFFYISGMINVFAVLVAKILGFETKDSSEHFTEEHIRYLVEESEEHGNIEHEEKEMINNIFDFDDKTVTELMTHRTNITGVEINQSISEVVYHAVNDGFSRIPVYEDDVDNIKGIIYVKDLLCLVGCSSSSNFKISDFTREVLYVPESKKCIDLFQSFKQKKVHMAVVVDDYGGTAGIITMEDLLEAIVGNIQDEYDDEKEKVSKIDESTYILDGTLALEKIEKLFDISIEYDEDSDTLGGYIVNEIGHIPSEGEHPTISIEGISFTVILVEERRISRVKSSILSE